MKTSVIGNIIVDVTKMKPQAATEDRAKFLKRCLTSIDAGGDAVWKKLPEEAQVWFNSAAKLLNAKQPLVDFSDLKEEPAAEAAAAEKPAPAAKDEEAPKADAAPTKTNKVTSEGLEDAPDAPKKKRGAVRRVRELVIENQQATREEVQIAMTAEGFSIAGSTIDAIIYDTRQTIEVAKSLGVWKS